MEEAHLLFADRCIAEGERRILDQEALLARLENRGAQTEAAMKLLALLNDTLELWKQHRAMIVAALAA